MSTMATMREMAASAAARPDPGASHPNMQHQEYIHRSAWKAGVMGALNVATLVLSVRLTLLLAVCGAFVLALLSLNGADMYRLGVLIAYSVVVVVPLVALAARR